MSTNASKRPPLAAMVYRSGKGCQQYCFESAEQLEQFAKRHPYRNETLRIMPVFDYGILGDAWMAADKAAEFVRTSIAKAQAKGAGQ